MIRFIISVPVLLIITWGELFFLTKAFYFPACLSNLAFVPGMGLLRLTPVRKNSNAK